MFDPLSGGNQRQVGGDWFLFGAFFDGFLAFLDQTGPLEQSEANLQGFLSLELDLGFTLIQIAKTHRELGNMEHFKISRHNAIKAADSIHRFQSRLPDDAKRSILKRCSELEEAISTL